MKTSTVISAIKTMVEFVPSSLICDAIVYIAKTVVIETIKVQSPGIAGMNFQTGGNDV